VRHGRGGGEAQAVTLENRAQKSLKGERKKAEGGKKVESRGYSTVIKGCLKGSIELVTVVAVEGLLEGGARRKSIGRSGPSG